MCTELDDLPIPLPKDWTASIRSAVLNIIGLLRIGMLTGRESLIQEGDVLHAKVLRLETEVSMLREGRSLRPFRPNCERANRF